MQVGLRKELRQDAVFSKLIIICVQRHRHRAVKYFTCMPIKRAPESGLKPDSANMQLTNEIAFGWVDTFCYLSRKLRVLAQNKQTIRTLLFLFNQEKLAAIGERLHCLQFCPSI